MAKLKLKKFDVMDWRDFGDIEKREDYPAKVVRFTDGDWDFAIVVHPDGIYFEKYDEEEAGYCREFLMSYHEAMALFDLINTKKKAIKFMKSLDWTDF